MYRSSAPTACATCRPAETFIARAAVTFLVAFAVLDIHSAVAGEVPNQELYAPARIPYFARWHDVTLRETAERASRSQSRTLGGPRVRSAWGGALAALWAWQRD